VRLPFKATAATAVALVVAIVVSIAIVTTSARSRADGPAKHEVVVGSKKFTESVILGEIASRLLAASGIPAVHRAELNDRS